MITRRQLAASALVTPILGMQRAAAQDATPLAAPVAEAPTTAEVLADWKTAQESLGALGNTVIDAFFAADPAPIVTVADPSFAPLVGSSEALQQIAESLVTNQIRFRYADVDAWFYGQFSSTGITGYMVQGSVFGFQAVPQAPQTESYPTGVWRGVLAPGVMDLRCELAFSGDAESLAVSLSVPAQMILDQPMDEVSFQTDVPIGERIDERSQPIGGDVIDNNLWSAEYEWGGHSLVFDTGWDTGMQLAGMQLSPLPPPATEEEQPPLRCHLPFAGAWLVFWGGETVFKNYHAAVASQRHALDIMIWKNGATCTGAGLTPEEYWCFGQPLLVPVAGTVVHVQDEFEDIMPQGTPNVEDHPAGNHIVIEADSRFVYLAHCKQGSIRVARGDVVAVGDVMAQVGNSGNTSEPHIHIHAQSVADFYDPEAVGIPLIFTDLLVNGESTAEAPLLQGSIVESA